MESPQLSRDSLAAIEAYWAEDLGCSADALKKDELVITRQGGLGLFIFARRGTVVSVPATLESGRIIGPAFIGYADAQTFAPKGEPVGRLLHDADDAAVSELRAACDPTEWKHGGPAESATRIGIFQDDELHGLASFERWGERIAHISVITHPAFRGHGLGKAAVAEATGVALERNLVAQYRTLVSNAPSMAIASGLGFRRYASTLAIRVTGET
jgi:GNAT superfamily N-acetyltransferase